jgi:hypothetical protein
MKTAPRGWVILTRKKVGDFQAQNDNSAEGGREGENEKKRMVPWCDWPK